MTVKRKPYKTYPEAFKLEALRLLEESDRPASEVARQLGIRRNQLYKWKEQMSQKGKVASSKRGRPRKEGQSEMAGNVGTPTFFLTTFTRLPSGSQMRTR
jgi:transposase